MAVRRPATRQFSVFVGVGIVCAVIDVGLMQMLVAIGAPVFSATTAGFLAGLGLNFLLHTRVTFRASYTHAALAKFMLIVLLNYLLTLFCVGLSANWLGNALIGKLLSLPLVAANGFLLSRHWVYR